MWIRVACPNGHALQPHEVRRAARNGTCPKCFATVSMWIKVKCPQGHELKVQTKYGGHTGKCPQCLAAVPIPKLGEEDIMALIGQMHPVADDKPVHQEPKHESKDFSSDGSVVTDGSTMLKRAPKTCPKCKAQVSPKYTICPHCRTFLPFIDDFEAAEATNSKMKRMAMSCPQCGVKSFPGASVCNNCGLTLTEKA